MSKRSSAWLAWTLCAVNIVLALFGLAQSLHLPGAASDTLSLADITLIAIYIVVFGAVGALIVSRQPRNTIGWLLMVLALSIAFLSVVLGGLQPTGAPLTEPTPANILTTWLNSWAWWLLIGPLLLILLLFPSGRPPSPRWKWVIVSLAITFVVFFVLATFGELLGDPEAVPPMRNPIGFIPESLVATILVFWPVLLTGTALLCASAIFVRYRRAGPVVRQQIKWLLLASGIFVGVYSVVGIQSGTGSGSAFQIVFDLSILGIPLAIGVAILRYGLWDIDVVIRRTLVYSMLSGLLVLSYFASVLVLQNIFGALTGQRQSTLVTVLSTLAIAALFVPLRQWVQRVIDRRLYRRKYNAARTLAAFGASLRDETNLEQLTARLTEVVDQTMQPAQVDLWLRTDSIIGASQRGGAHD